MDAENGPAAAAASATASGGARPSSAIYPFLLAAFSGLCWSGNHIVGRYVAGEVPPFQLSFMRWLLPIFILWPFARHHLRRDWPVIRAHLGVIVFLSVMGGTIFSAFQYLGLQVTYALNVSVLNSVAPVMIAVASAVFFRDRLSASQALGIATSLLGVLAIVARGDLQSLVSLQVNWGDLLILFNMGVWAVYSAGLRLRPKMHWLSFLFVFCVISAATTLPMALAEAFISGPMRPNATSVLASLYVALFPGLAAMATWNRGVELMGANRAGACLHLIPLYSAVLASLLLGEELRLFHIVGFGLILAGVALAARPAAPAVAKP